MTTAIDTRTQTGHIRNIGIKVGDALYAWDRYFHGQPTVHPVDTLNNVITAARTAIGVLSGNPDDAVEAVCRKVNDRLGHPAAGLDLTAQRAAQWLDDINGRSADELDMRVMKLLEEVGEVGAAWTAYRAQNPRKPQGPLSDVVAELGDVILTAATAIASIEVA